MRGASSRRFLEPSRRTFRVRRALVAAMIASAFAGSIVALFVELIAGLSCRAIAEEPGTLEKSPLAKREPLPFRSPFVEQGQLAPLKWEPDLLTLWDRAERLMMSERDDAAWPLVQKVIDESRDVLVEAPAEDEQVQDKGQDKGHEQETNEKERAREEEPDRAPAGGNVVAVGPRGVSAWTRYEPLSRAVERRLLALTPETRRRYELYAGGEARAFRAARPDDDATRAEIVRRYFVTRIGADAAWSLALSALDRSDFVTTADLCRRLLDEHPEPTVKRGELLLRLVVATAHLGEANAFKQLEREVETIRRDCGAERTAVVLEYAKTLLDGGDSHVPASTRWGDASPLSVGSVESGATAASGRATSPGGSALVRQLDDSRTRTTVSEWLASRLERESVPASSGDPALERLGWNESPATAAARLLQAGNLGAGFDHLFASTDPRMLRQLAVRAGWAPVASVVFVEDGVVTRDVGGVSRWRFVGGSFERVWRVDSQSPYAAPAGWLQLPSREIRSPLGVPRVPQTWYEAALLRDRAAASLAIIGSRLYSFEGAPREPREGDAAPTTIVPRKTLSGRIRSNRLVCRSLETGEVVWARTAAEPDDARQGDVGFVGAPLAAAGRLIVPVLDGATSELRALSREGGATIWRTVLCDEPRMGGPTWSRTALDRAGRHLYCAPGLGVVAAVDEASGAIRWVARYPRTARPDSLATNAAGAAGGSSASSASAGRDDTGLTWDGWRDDQVLAVGSVVLVAVSDSDELIALDRITGQPRWIAPRRLSSDGAALRIVGADEKFVWLETAAGVRTLELATGRLVSTAARRPASERLPNPLALLHELATAARLVEVTKELGHSPQSQPAALAKPSPPIERSMDEKNVGVLVSDGANGRVAEMDWAGNERWSVGGLGLPGACCQAENGSRWVVTHRPLALREISRDGRLVERAVALASRAASLEGVRDGRLLCSFPDRNLVAELDDVGRIGWSVKVAGRPVDARRLADGRTLVCLLEDRRVVEIDASGRIVWDGGDVAQPRAAVRTADGRTVVTSLGANLAVELSPAFSSEARVSERPPSETPSLAVTWTRSGLRQPLAALRGPGAKTLLSDQAGLVLVEAGGGIVWRKEGLIATGVALVVDGR